LVVRETGLVVKDCCYCVCCLVWKNSDRKMKILVNRVSVLQVIGDFFVFGPFNVDLQVEFIIVLKLGSVVLGH